MTVSIAMIVKNEERCLARCLDSLRDAVDEIVVVDTGSHDATKGIARRYTNKVFDYEWHQDFAAARQYAFDRATCDWVAWVDADDVVVGANRIRPLLRSAPPQVAGFHWRYVYQRDSWGNPHCEFWRERCVRNDGSFRWVGRIHEVLSSDHARSMVRTDDVVIEHHSDETLSGAKVRRNLEILEGEYASTEKPPPRLLFYLASEYASVRETHKALRLYKKYLRIADWKDERYIVQTRVARIYRELKRYDDAITADFEALKICPHWPGAYFGLAESYYYLKEWHKVIHWTEVGRAMPQPDTIHIINTMDYRYNWIIYFTNALYHVDEVREALRWTERALEICPNDPSHSENLLCFVRALQTSKEPGSAGSDSPRPVLPQPSSDIEIANEPTSDLRESGVQKDVFSVGFYCPFEWQPWSPRVLTTEGAGGSETAAICMAKSLADLGHCVTVFNHNDGEACYDGVSYVDYRRFNPSDPREVLIAWRSPELADLGEVGQQRYLWMHDLDVGDRLTLDRAEKFSRILALSEAHKAHLLSRYSFIDERRVHVTRNGLDLSRFDQTVPRNPNRLIYSSWPDRGLDVLLTIFPMIKQQCPEAVLDVYGWAGLDLAAQLRPDLLVLKETLMRLLDQPGVKYHGQVDQIRLAREMLGSGLWVYPTPWHETSCITAMEAQAAGAVPVTRPLAALEETVRFGRLLDGDVHHRETQNRYVDAVVSLIRHPKEQQRIRAEMIPWARAAFGWQGVAQEWHRWFVMSKPARRDLSVRRFQGVGDVETTAACF